MEDEKLLDLAAGGDRDALTELLERHGPAVRGVIAPQIPRRWRSLLAVDDVMQETYTDAFLDVVHFQPRGPGAFTAWLLTLAKRNLLDALRMLEAEKRGKKRRRIERPPTEESLALLHERLAKARGTPSGQAARKEACAALQEAIEQLPPTYRNVVKWYDLEGRPVADVAAALKRSPGAVFMLLRRAHGRLHDLMDTASLFLSWTT